MKINPKKMYSVKTTSKYNLFERNKNNRTVNLAKHKKLKVSMETYGFLPWWPIVCFRSDSGKLLVKDGQHRLAISKALGLPVWYIICDNNFDIAVINDTQKTWEAIDYAQVHQANGLTDYSRGLEFLQEHNLSIGNAFALLAGQMSFSNIRDSFRAGTFKVTSFDWATLVAETYAPLAALKKEARHTQMLGALMLCCLVPEFNPHKLVNSAERNRDMIVSCSSREGFLGMLEGIYNYRCSTKNKIPLKHLAEKYYAEKFTKED